MKLASVPLAYLALAWLLGLLVAASSNSDQGAALAAAGILGAASVSIRPRLSTLVLVVGGVALILGAGWRYQETIPSPGSIARFNDGQAVQLRAVISDEPSEQGTSRLYRLDVREARVGGTWREESGGVIVRAPLLPTYTYGDLVEIRGKLETPPVLDDFDYREYLLRQGVVSQVGYPEISLIASGHGSPIRAKLIDVRKTLARSLGNVLPEPEAALAGGILFGARSDLPADLKADMNATGTSHLVAVSGQNVVLVAMLMIASLAWIIGRRPAAWIALLAVIGYAILVGGQPSVVRAAIMGGIYVVAIIVGRPGTSWIGLALAGAVMTGLNPQVVHDVSFQLSFAATLGLVVMTAPLSEVLKQILPRWPPIEDFPLTRLMSDVAVSTVAATAFTLPIVAINFQRVSPIAPLANLLAVPAFVLVAATAGAATIAQLVIPGSEDLTSWVVWPPAAYMIWVIRLFADAPIASTELKGVHVEHAIVYYGLLIAGVWWLSRLHISVPEVPPPSVGPSRHFPLVPAGAPAIVLVLASCLVWLALTAAPEGRLSVTFLDVGQGDAILIEDPAGHRILVDGGPSGEVVSAALGRNLPFYDRRIDLIVLTHPQADHLGGLPTVIERYHVGQALTGAAEGTGWEYHAWVDTLRSQNVPRIEAFRGEQIDLGGGARISVLNPPAGAGLVAADELNDSSVVLRLEMGDVSFLLTGDIGAKGERQLMSSGAKIGTTVLKVAHHGSKTSSSPQFLRRARPIIGVISVGENNPFGHPTAQVLERLKDDLILRTDKNGDITLSTDGRRLWLETQRSSD